MRRRALAQSNERLQSAMRLNKAQLESVEIGKRRLAQDEALAAQELRLQRISTARVELEKRQFDLQKARASLTIARNTQGVRAQEVLATPGVSPRAAQTATAMLARLDATEASLAARETILARQTGYLDDAQAKAAITAQRLAANEEALAATAVRLNDRLRIDAEQLQINAIRMNELAIAERRVKFERLQQMAQALSHIGRTAQLAGAITVAAFGLMGKAAADFQSQATLAATQAQTPVATVRQQSGFIQKSTLDLMRQFPATAQEVTTSFYDIFSSMDVGRAKALALEKSFNRLSVAGMAPLEDVTNAGITIMNNFASALDNPEKAMNQVLATVRFGRLTVQQYTGTLTQLVPAFKNAFGGGADSLLQMNAALAETTRLMPSQRASGTGLARLVEMFQRPQFSEGLKNLGVNIRDANGRLIPFSEIMERISKSTNPFVHGLHDRTTSTIEFFKALSGTQGTVQGRRVFNALLNDIEPLHKRLGQINNDTNELNRSFNSLRNSPGVQWQVVVNTFKAVAIEIGYGVIPAVQSLLKHVQPITDWFQNLSPQTKRTIGELGLLAGAFITIGGVLASIIGAFGSAYGAIRLLLLGRGGLAELGTTLGAEGGFIRGIVAVRLGLIGLAAILLPLAIRTGHLKDAIQLLVAVMTATAILRFSRTLGGIFTILPGLTTRMQGAAVQTAQTKAEFEAAEAEAAALRATLSSIAAIGVITVAIEIIIHHQQITNAINKALAAAGIPTAAGVHAPRNRTQAQAVADAVQVAKAWHTSLDKAARQTMTKEEYALFTGRNTRTGPQGNAAEAAVKVARGTNAYTLGQRGPRARHTPTKPPPPFTDADTMAAIRNIIKLDTAYAKNPSLAAARQKNAALAALEKKLGTDRFAIAQELISSLESQDKAHTRKAVSEAKKRASELKKQRKKAAQEAKKDMEDAQQQIQQVQQTLTSTFTAAQQQNQQAFGTLFQGPFVNSARVQNRLQFGGRLTGHDLLADIKAQVSQFRQWRRALGQLQRRGVPYDLLQQIMQAGPQALPEVRALLSLNQKEFNQYTQAFNQGQRLVERASVRDMNQTMRHWRSLGKNIMNAILKGMDEQSAKFQDYFRNLAISLFPDLAKTGKVAPKPVAFTPGHSVAGAATAPPVGHKGPDGSTIIDSPTYVIQGTRQTDISTALRKTKQFHKSRYGGRH